jgi:uncharacterized membrane protein
MEKDRLLAFSDGVIAIIITIMVLEMHPPHTPDVAGLWAVWPVFLSYVLSFINVGIYWNNHHHMMQTVKHVTGGMLWANTHLLFWLSLIPFATGWMGENHFAALPVAVYGVALLGPALAYALLEKVIIAAQGRDSLLEKAVQGVVKEQVSVLLYAAGIALALWVNPYLSLACYVVVAAMWLVPDRRIENKVARKGSR